MKLIKHKYLDVTDYSIEKEKLDGTIEEITELSDDDLSYIVDLILNRNKPTPELREHNENKVWKKKSDK